MVATVTDALLDEPDCVPLLVIRARAHIGLRRDLEAQADLRDIIRLDPQCGIAYRLLGELAARRDENDSAAIFFREAIRLDPEDREAADWLVVVEPSLRPSGRARSEPRVRASSPNPERIAHGTKPPEDEGPTHRMGSRHEAQQRARFARGSTPPEQQAWKTPTPVAPFPIDEEPASRNTISGRPPTQPPAKEAPRLAPQRPMPRGPVPELPGFGDYLVSSGILTRERLRAAQAYQRSMKVQLSTAIVTLGLATPQRIEWASVAHQSQLARDRANAG